MYNYRMYSVLNCSVGRGTPLDDSSSSKLNTVFMNSVCFFPQLILEFQPRIRKHCRGGPHLLVHHTGMYPAVLIPCDVLLNSPKPLLMFPCEQVGRILPFILDKPHSMII